MQQTKGLSITKLLNVPQTSVVAMVMVAAIGLSTGFITYNAEPESSPQTTTLDANLPEVVKAPVKPNKYDNVNLGTEPQADTSFFPDLNASATGKEKAGDQVKGGEEKTGSNEDLSIEQIARQNGVAEPAWQNRQQVRTHYNRELDHLTRQNRQSIRDATQPASLSAQELADRRSQDDALERAARLEQMALNQMENLNAYGAGQYGAGQSSRQGQNMYSNTAVGNTAVGNAADRFPAPSVSSVPITRVTVANLDKYIEVPKETAHQNVFYGLKGEQKKPETVASQPVPNSIEAVIHGDADNVNVTDGSTLKIRVLQDIQVGKYILPKNSILTGECGIQGERVHVLVSSIRIQNSIIPVKLLAYDIDGHAGIYVPNLAVKQQVSQTGSQAVTGGSINMPYMVPTNANVGQMVVGQTASQGVNLAINGARSLAARKMSQSKAVIRPNYRIYLKQE